MDNLDDQIQNRVYQIITMSVERYGLEMTYHALAYVLPSDDYEKLSISREHFDGVPSIQVFGLTPGMALKITDCLSSYKDYFVQQEQKILADKARRVQGLDKAVKFIQEMQKELT